MAYEHFGFENEGLLYDDDNREFTDNNWKKSVCSNCEDKQNNYYCDIKDPSCLNLQKFKDRVFGKDLLQIKCRIKDSNKMDITTNLIMPYFYKYNGINGWITSNFYQWEKSYKTMNLVS